MGLVLAVTTGLVAWLVLWSLDVKAIDAFLLTTAIALVAAMARMLSPFAPGKRGNG